MLVLGFKKPLYLLEAEQLGHIALILGCYDWLVIFILKTVVLPSLVGDFRVVQNVSLQKEVLDLKHIHFELVSDDLCRLVILRLAHPVYWVSVRKNTYLRQAEPQLSRLFLPLSKLLYHFQVALLIIAR